MAHPDFPGATGYLNTASVGLPPTSVADAMHAAVDDWVMGRATAPGYDVYVQRSRDAWARLHGVDPAHVAIGPQVSYFAGLVARSLPAGAEVVGYNDDFTSLLFPFLARGDLEVRLVPFDAVADAVGPGTAVVAVSAVQSSDGRVADLDAIAGAAAAHGAATVVDATQASGWLPIDGRSIDFLIAGTYKWLMSPRGTAYMSVRPEALGGVTPYAAGWYSADKPWQSVYGPPLRLASDGRRLDMSPAWLCWVGTAAAIDYVLETGVESVHRHDVGLANGLREGLGMPPSDSAIVSIDLDGAPGALADAGLRVGGLAGAARVCFHIHNDESDVDAVLEALGRRR